MRIGIDISQTAYTETGVANFLVNLITELVQKNDINLVLFYSSFRHRAKKFSFDGIKNVTLRRFPFPPWILDILWNKLHIIPVESFIGDIDVFISSDWTQPPIRCGKSATILYDLIVYKYPEETAGNIVATQKRRLAWVKKECDLLLCISEATKKDAIDILMIPEEKLKVVYPGN